MARHLRATTISKLCCYARLLTATSLLGIMCTAGHAQTPAGQDDAAEEQAAPPPGSDNQAQPTDDIVVTGSRIARRDYNSTSPIVTVSTKAIENAGASTIEASLSQLPQFTPSFGAADAWPVNRGGQANLNLRGLGSNRALVLLDGRRIQPSNPDSTIDVNVIPTALIESVETITGGASSTYGSDAMSGVVNFRLKRNFSGVQMDAQSSITSRGDGATQSLSILAGRNFNEGRGNIVLFGSYAHRDEVQRGDRSLFELSFPNTRLPIAIANLTAAPPSAAAVDAVFARYGFAPGSVAPPTSYGVNANGTVFSNPGNAPVRNYLGPLNSSFVNFKNAISYNSGQTVGIQIPLNRYSGFAKLNYEITDNIKVFVQALYTGYDNYSTISPVSYGAAGQNGSVPVTNPFIPADLRELLASRANPNANFPVTYLFQQLGNLTLAAKWKTYQVTGGASGSLANGWTWDTYISSGKTKNITTLENTASKAALQTLLNAADGGASLCSGGLNLFTANGISASCAAYIKRSNPTRSVFDETSAEANLQGSIFNLPAGEVRFATGLAYRKDSYSFDPNAAYQQNDVLGFAISLPASGSQNVKEVYGELLVPLLKDLPLINEANLTLGYRYSDYSTINSVHTYKVDGDWSVNDFMRFRGGYSRSIRAPSLGELFAPTTSNSVTIGSPSATGVAGDPCDIRSSYRLGANGTQVRALCLAQGVPASAIDNFAFTSTQVFANTAGNINLREEKADTYSLGIVLNGPSQSPLLKNIRTSVDYYSIKISDAIGALPFATGLARCFNSDGSNPSYSADNINCVVVSRNAVGTISSGSIATLNLGSYTTKGIDAQIDWSTEVGSLGRIGINAVGTYIEKFKLQTLPGATPLDYVGYTSSGITTNVLPRFKSQTTISASNDTAELSLRWRHLSSLKDISKQTTPTSTIAGVKKYDYFDLIGRLRISEKFELRGIVSNLFDKGPPQIGTAPGTTDGSTYDLLGRNFFLAIKAVF